VELLVWFVAGWGIAARRATSTVADYPYPSRYFADRLHERTAVLTSPAKLPTGSRFMILLALIAGAAGPSRQAVALGACLADAVGPWRGPVLNGSGIEDMVTTFSLGADGRLVGRYHIEDAVPFDGTLNDFRETGPCAGDFHWHDFDGSGTVHIQFQPEQGRFLGRWGLDWPGPGHVFNGYRNRPPPVS